MTYKTDDYLNLQFWQLDEDWREVRRWMVANTDAMLSAENYIGEGRPAGMASSGIMQHRDSNLLDRANFIAAKEMLEAHSESVDVRSVSHWAVGWCESLYVPLTKACCVEVQRIHDALFDYPILDESLYYEMEYEEAVESWDSWGWHDTCRLLDEDVEEFLDDNAYPHEDFYAIAEDIMNQAQHAFTEEGYSEDALSSNNAAEAIETAVEDWHQLHAWNIATSGGMQETLTL